MQCTSTCLNMMILNLLLFQCLISLIFAQCVFTNLSVNMYYLYLHLSLFQICSTYIYLTLIYSIWRIMQSSSTKPTFDFNLYPISIYGNKKPPLGLFDRPQLITYYAGCITSWRASLEIGFLLATRSLPPSTQHLEYCQNSASKYNI